MVWAPLWETPRVVFASLTFLLFFLPLHLIGYALLRAPAARNAWLTLSSLVFYAWGEPVWIVLLLFSAAIDFVHGLLCERWRGSRWAKVPLASSLLLNLGLLGLFKYAAFAATTLHSVTGLQLDVPALSLPIGISFYTFQTISYVVDVSRGQVAAQRSWPSFLMYVCSFHQLVAGPIVRYADIAAEIDRRSVTAADVADGTRRFCIGLGKKVLLANVAGELVQATLGATATPLAASTAWLGVCAFALQIYFDFSGYSDMAIGLGRMVGFHYAENFRHPYVSQSIGEFWRRWHISLGRFFRDYVYIPLGGNRSWALRNLLIVWGLTGLWHGASWNFVAWGLYYGLWIGLERAGLAALLERAPRALRHLYVVPVLLVGWVLFYFTDLAQLQGCLAAMFGLAAPSPQADATAARLLADHAGWWPLALLFCLPVGPALARWTDAWTDRVPSWRRPAAVAAALSNALVLTAAIALLVGRSYNPFLYFRF